MKNTLILFLALLFIPSICFTQEAALQTSPKYKEQPLTLTIKSDKHVYKVGEEVDIKLTIKNISKDEVVIHDPLNDGVSEIIVIDSKGIKIEPKEISVARMFVGRSMSIPQNESSICIFEGLGWWDSAAIYRGFDLDAGVYNIYVTLTSPSKCYPECYPSFDDFNFKGTLTSNTIQIEVRGKKVGASCNSYEDCLNVNCLGYEVPGVKEGYKPYCVNNKCKCMCYGCE